VVPHQSLFHHANQARLCNKVEFKVSNSMNLKSQIEASLTMQNFYFTRVLSWDGSLCILICINKHYGWPLSLSIGQMPMEKTTQTRDEVDHSFFKFSFHLWLLLLF